MKLCTYDILFAPLTREQKLTSLKLMTLFGATAAPSSENINLINRIMSRSAKAMGISGDAVRSYDFGSIENATAILDSISDREALDLLFLAFFNIISIGKDDDANIEIARKSIVAACPIKKGEMFTEDNLTVKRPGNGISPMRWNEVIGKVATKDFEEEEMIAL